MSKTIKGNTRYFFDNDGDGHWYMVPTHLEKWWDDLNRDAESDDDDRAVEACDQINRIFGKYRVDSIRKVTFERPSEE